MNPGSGARLWNSRETGETHRPASPHPIAPVRRWPRSVGTLLSRGLPSLSPEGKPPPGFRPSQQGSRRSGPGKLLPALLVLLASLLNAARGLAAAGKARRKRPSGTRR